MKIQKWLNLGASMPFLGIFDQSCHILVLLGRIFKKPIVIFQINILGYVSLQNFTKKEECLNLGRKVPVLGIFGLEIENNIVIFEINIAEFV